MKKFRQTFPFLILYYLTSRCSVVWYCRMADVASHSPASDLPTLIKSDSYNINITRREKCQGKYFQLLANLTQVVFFIDNVLQRIPLPQSILILDRIVICIYFYFLNIKDPPVDIEDFQSFFVKLLKIRGHNFSVYSNWVHNWGSVEIVSNYWRTLYRLRSF